MRNLAVGLVAGLAFGGVIVVSAYTAGLAKNAESTERALDTADYYKAEAFRVADRMAHLASNRMGLANESFRECLVEARVTP